MSLLTNQQHNQHLNLHKIQRRIQHISLQESQHMSLLTNQQQNQRENLLSNLQLQLLQREVNSFNLLFCVLDTVLLCV